ncbi:MAG TPA: 4-hydroxy-tetrahydrodipicolinate synthase [Sphingobacteriaceae bacterium]|nr:4-hydroxy-tetrahydrodipicolinate synthase [Sphingobacteriaceae bacterium]
MKELMGAGVALVTPFDQYGDVDFVGLERLIEHQIMQGMNYLVSLGTTGETATLSAAERNAVWQFTSDKVAGRVPLVAGIGGNNTADIVAQITAFNHSGYSAFLSVSPYYNKPTQEGIYEHYKKIAQAAALPIILYNVPGRTGSNMEAGTTLRLAREFSNIVAVKEASGNFDQINKILRDKPAEFLLISGDDPVTLPMMALGAVGVISVVGNILPKEVADLVELCAAGHFEKAQQIHSRLLRITELCFAEGNPAGVKQALEQMEICGSGLRLPLTGVSQLTAEAIREELRVY